MVTFKIPYVLRYGTAPKPGSPDNRPYRYRRVVPPNVRGKIGRKSWFKTWRVGTPDSVIQHKARELAVQHDNEIAVAKGEKIETEARDILAGPPIEKYQILALYEEFRGLLGKLTPEQESLIKAIDGGGTAQLTAPLLSVAMDADIEAGKGADDTRPIRYAVRHFIDLIGDKPVTAITRADVEAWLASFNGSAPATVKRRLGSICGLLNRTILSLEINQKNPFEKHRIRDANGNAKRLPFSKAHLKLIDAHLAAEDGGPDRETRNIVNLLRNTGARLSEIGGLVIADCILDDGDIPFITIRDNAVRDVKSDAATRRVPLLGIAQYAARDAVKHAKGRGDNPDKVALFECFDGSDKAAKALSTKCCNVIRAAGITSKRLTAHSLRHTIIEALKCAGIADRVLKRLVGHSSGSVTARYGSPALRLTESKDAFVAALKILGDVDESIFSDAERL